MTIFRYAAMLLLVSAVVGAYVVSPVWAVSSQAVRGTIGKTMDVEKDIQETQAAWVQESDSLFVELESLEKEKKRLTLKKERLLRVQALEQKKYDEYIRRQKEMRRLKNEIASFLDMIVGKLEASVSNSLPFLAKERKTRLDAVKDLLVDPDETWAEKFRQVFSALQIEAEYGTTVDVDQETIPLEGTNILVDVLRLGRISLFFQSVDHKKSGYYHIGDKAWKSLPAKYNAEIKKAISMARRERTVDLVDLPVGRIIVQ